MIYTKSDLRKDFANLRGNITPEIRATEQIQTILKLRELLLEINPEICGIYSAIGSEFSLEQLPEIMNAQKFALPYIDDTNQMQFSELSGELSLGKFGILQPKNPRAIIPQIIITPLLAADETGVRLGYGGGYYDKYFAQSPAITKIGVGFSCQFSSSPLPHENHDVKLDYFVCATKIIKI